MSRKPAFPARWPRKFTPGPQTRPLKASGLGFKTGKRQSGVEILRCLEDTGSERIVDVAETDCESIPVRLALWSAATEQGCLPRIRVIRSCL
jgi:hypothetical protein